MREILANNLFTLNQTNTGSGEIFKEHLHNHII